MKECKKAGTYGFSEFLRCVHLCPVHKNGGVGIAKEMVVKVITDLDQKLLFKNQRLKCVFPHCA